VRCFDLCPCCPCCFCLRACLDPVCLVVSSARPSTRSLPAAALTRFCPAPSLRRLCPGISAHLPCRRLRHRHRLGAARLPRTARMSKRARPSMPFRTRHPSPKMLTSQSMSWMMVLKSPLRSACAKVFSSLDPSFPFSFAIRNSSHLLHFEFSGLSYRCLPVELVLISCHRCSGSSFFSSLRRGIF
jgi:hypothetical protein